MGDIKFGATSFAVPQRIISNDELSEFMDTTDEWISKRTGIKQRHISDAENTSALATKVAKDLLKKENLAPAAIDLIIVATMSPDSMTPSTAAIVQGNILAKNAVAFDISAACSGYSYAITLARAMMLTNHYQHAIVIGAEVLSKLLDWHDRSTAVLFGDGAGGVLLHQSKHQHVLSTDLHTYGELGNKLVVGQTVVNQNFLENDHQISSFQMNGRYVYRFATHEVPKSIVSAVKKANLTLDEVDCFLLHQANERIITQVARKLEQKIAKFPLNIAEYGNTAAASEAILLAECIQKKIIKTGDIVALSGFGGGLTTATVIFKY